MLDAELQLLDSVIRDERLLWSLFFPNSTPDPVRTAHAANLWPPFITAPTKLELFEYITAALVISDDLGVGSECRSRIHAQIHAKMAQLVEDTAKLIVAGRLPRLKDLIPEVKTTKLRRSSGKENKRGKASHRRGTTVNKDTNKHMSICTIEFVKRWIT
ncbi:hypothetical protein MIND_00517900 [Mycena indigotica]|uniref:Uncharacterized protein n=1 Tax=Mycena indigotica TaxID=2126181 RepID=A0A8H6SZN2_9AGAR|nr:uncharacterized protein MIND_00517900 [Mycena indigotica]KAF7307242.1 hypothetical protein MIND_00517900 [Mycena indigotica]